MLDNRQVVGDMQSAQLIRRYITQTGRQDWVWNGLTLDTIRPCQVPLCASNTLNAQDAALSSAALEADPAGQRASYGCVSC